MQRITHCLVSATLAVLVILTTSRSPAQAPADDLNERIRQALNRARPLLLAELEAGHGGPLALLCLALAGRPATEH